MRPLSKTCTKCNDVKPVDEFHRKSSSPDGYFTMCKVCRAAHYEAYRATVAEKLSERRRQYYAENREEQNRKNNERNRANKERYAARRAQHYQENKSRIAAETRARRVYRRYRATPRWLSGAQRAAIQVMYDHARYLSKVSGTPYHVDHIIPLRHPDVCGLHVPWNLQVVTGEFNDRKGNRLYRGGECAL